MESENVELVGYLFWWRCLMWALQAQERADWRHRRKGGSPGAWTTLPGPALAPFSPGYCFWMEDSLESPFMTSLHALPKGSALSKLPWQACKALYILTSFYCFSFFAYTPLIVTATSVSWSHTRLTYTYSFPEMICSVSLHILYR